MTRDEILSMEAGPAMDALVAERVMGCKIRYDRPRLKQGPRCGCRGHVHTHSASDRCCGGYEPGCEGDTGAISEYSTDIAAAWEVLGRLRGRRGNVTLEWRVCEAPDIHPESVVSSAAGEATGRVGEMPLAICRAALLATL